MRWELLLDRQVSVIFRRRNPALVGSLTRWARGLARTVGYAMSDPF
jgi:hypothetical protein